MGPGGNCQYAPAIATCLLGVIAGHTLGSAQPSGTCWRLLRCGRHSGGGHPVYLQSSWLPINKKLWTDSFTLFMGGLDFVNSGRIHLARGRTGLAPPGETAGDPRDERDCHLHGQRASGRSSQSDKLDGGGRNN